MEFILYLILQATVIKNSFITLGWVVFGVIGIAHLIIGIIYFNEKDNLDNLQWDSSRDVATKNIENMKKWYPVFFKKTKKIIIASLVIIFMSMFLPSTKNCLIIFGVSKFTKSEIFHNVNETTNKAIKLLNSKLDDYLQEEKSE